MVQYSMKQDSKKKLVYDGAAVSKSTTTDALSSSSVLLTPEEQVYRDTVVPLLLIRAYHLPNHTYCQDLSQYMCNNHPIFGIFLHHVYHPVQRNIRIISLIGSMLFGLAITNIIYLAFVFTNIEYDTSYVEANTVGDGTNNTTSSMSDIIDTTVPALSITNGNIALWTIGATVHAAFDNLIWSLAACSCCTNGKETGSYQTEQKIARYRNTGVVLVILFVVIATALATFAVALRAAMSSPSSSLLGNVTSASNITTTVVVDPDMVQSYGFTDDTVQLFQVEDATNDFEFMIAYFIELVLNYFIYYPLVGTVLFSGVLSCGGRCCTNTLGGRPYEMKIADMGRERLDRTTKDNIQASCTTKNADIEQPKKYQQKN